VSSGVQRPADHVHPDLPTRVKASLGAKTVSPGASGSAHAPGGDRQRAAERPAGGLDRACQGLRPTRTRPWLGNTTRPRSRDEHHAQSDTGVPTTISLSWGGG